MTSYHYNPGERPSAWEGISDDAMKALGASVLGGSSADLRSPLEAQFDKYNRLSSETFEWAAVELYGAFDGWQDYGDQLSLPPSVDEFLLDYERGPETLERLHQILKDVAATNERVPGTGGNLADTLHLVLIPWQAFRDNLPQINRWLVHMRQKRNLKPDNIVPPLVDTLKGEYPFYSGNIGRNQYSATEYLDHMVRMEGPWGLMLMQTSDLAGSNSLFTRNAAALMNDGERAFNFAGHEADYLGVFEWLALTLQIKKERISWSDQSWLLANWEESGNKLLRAEFNGSQGSYRISLAESTQYSEGDQRIMPRFAFAYEGIRP